MRWAYPFEATFLLLNDARMVLLDDLFIQTAEASSSSSPLRALIRDVALGLI